MTGDLLERPLIHMPQWGRGEWLNTPFPVTQDHLRGRVVLVDFWDYTCINCLRTLPYLRRWHERYHECGLEIIGVHSPEFSFAQDAAQVAGAVREFELPYPVLLDPRFETWSRFANRAWPTKHLFDSRGYLRYRRQGEGFYSETEEAIQLLLREAQPGLSLPPVAPPLRSEDASGAICYRTTPELYAGYRGGGLFGGALGNEEGYATRGIMMYGLPDKAERQEGRFYLEGFWQALPEGVAFAGEEGGRVILPYRALGVNAVLSPTGDEVELMLNLRPTTAEALLEVRQDGAPVPRAWAGQDLRHDASGRSYLTLDRPRLYEIVRNARFGRHELELICHARGLALYTFTFSTCKALGASPDSPEVFSRP